MASRNFHGMLGRKRIAKRVRGAELVSTVSSRDGLTRYTWRLVLACDHVIRRKAEYIEIAVARGCGTPQERQAALSPSNIKDHRPTAVCARCTEILWEANNG